MAVLSGSLESSSFACSPEILLLNALWISFFASSSTSFPSGAFVTKSMSATVVNSFIIRLPPLSPSTNAVTTFFPHKSTIVCGTDVPFMAIAFLKPCFNRFKTSALPSTTMTSSLSSIAGPAGSLSLPYSTISITLTEAETSSANSWESGIVFSIIFFSSSFALSITMLLLLTLTSSIFVTSSFALHGPILCIISKAAPTMLVSALSNEEGIIMVPLVLPVLVSVLTSILPILPDFCISLSSKSAPSSPSVWPKIAQITSGLSTTPSISILASTIYLDDTWLILPILICLQPQSQLTP